jgi:hypothetical protein
MLTGRDELHLAMGEFLTECSNLENILLALMMFCQPDRPFDEVHLEMLDKTFGVRLKEFKKVSGAYAFTEHNRRRIDEAIIGLDDLLPRRNLIIHGYTYEVRFGDSQPKVYRVGIPKGNLDYMNQFLVHAADVKHSFSAGQVRQAVIDCKVLANKLGPIISDSLKLPVNFQKPMHYGRSMTNGN